MTLRELLEYRVLTISNIISLLRLVASPVIAILAFRLPDSRLEFSLLIILVAISDWADGFLARLFHQETPLGQYLDPVADKAAYLTTIWCLSLATGFSWPLTIMLTIREVIGTAGGLFLLIKRRVLGRPNIWGKANIALIFLSVLTHVWRAEFVRYLEPLLLLVNLAGLVVYTRTYARVIFQAD